MKTLNNLTINYETPGIITVYPKANTTKYTWDNPCQNCLNNSMINKFASRVCNCALPTLRQQISII